MQSLHEECVKLSTEETAEEYRSRRTQKREERAHLRTQTQEEFEKNKHAIWNQAYQEAFDHIVEGSTEKIRNAARLGYKSCNILRYETKQGLKFNSVYVRDCLTKGTTLTKLSEHFAPFTVTHRPIKKGAFIVCVSWSDSKTTEETS